MKAMKNAAVLILVMALCAAILAVPVFAATATQDGLEVTLITDKEAYTRDEVIVATLMVTNQNDFPVEGVRLETLVPEGYALTDETQSTMKVGTLEAGQSANLVVVLEATAAGTESTAPSQSQDEKQDADGEENPLPIDLSDKRLWVVGALVLILLFALLKPKKKKKRKKTMAIVLCLTMLASALPGVQVHAEEGGAAIHVTTSVTMDGQELLLQGNVSYDLG